MKSKTNKNLNQTFTILKGELQLNFPIWLIQIIITGAIMLFLLIICLAINANYNNTSYLFGINDNPGANLFQAVFTGFLLFTASVFSIIYMAKSFSYLYNKRKLDMYGSMPITRRCFFNSKVFSSFVMSVMVFIPFAVLSVIIGICMGATFENNEIQSLILFIFSVFFYISLYALCAVCSKSTLNALISLFIIEFFLPVTAGMIKYFLRGFFSGIDHYLIPDKFIGNIFSLSPDGDGELVYIVIWLVLSALFLLICNLFIKKRNSENTRRMFVMPLLEYAIKIILTFVAGLFIGLIVGALTVNNGFIGFIIGFLVASIPTYIVIHIIYNRGFTKLLKSSIVLGVLIVVSVGFFWLCDANPMNFNIVPNKEDIASAGLIDLQTPLTEIDADLILNSMSDFTEEKDINKIVTIHKEAASMQITYNTWVKCRLALMNMLTGTVTDAFAGNFFDNEGLIITYKFKNGFVNSYYYANECQQIITPEYYFYADSENTLYNNEKIADILAEIEISEKYREKYRPLFTNPDMIKSFEISYDVYGYEGSYYEDIYDYATEDNQNKEFIEHYKKLSNAFLTDLKNDKNASENNKPFLPSLSDDDVYYDDYYEDDYYEDDYRVAYGVQALNYNVTVDNEDHYLSNTKDKNTDAPLIIIFNYESDFNFISDMYYIPKSYTNTINVLKEIGAIKDDLSINEYYY